MPNDRYQFEDIRKFFVQRPWLGKRGYEDGLLTAEEYILLKERELKIEKHRAAYLRAFIDGWMRAKQ